MKILKRLLFSILLLIFLLLGLGYFYPFSNPKISQLLGRQLEQRLNKDVFIGKTTIYPLRKIKIDHFAIKDKGLLFSVESAELRYYPFIHQKKLVLNGKFKSEKIIFSGNFLSDILAIDIGLLEFDNTISDFFINKKEIYIKKLIVNGDKLDISLNGTVSKKGNLDCKIKIYLKESMNKNIHPALSFLLLKEEPFGLSKQKGLKSFSFKLTGNYKKPTISF